MSTQPASRTFHRVETGATTVDTPQAAAEKNITLYYREGSSDKVYRAELVTAPDKTGYLVNAAWGRRGSTMQTGSKTARPVPYERALAIYEKLVSEKTAKGYSPGENGAAFAATDNAARVSGLLPQLLNTIDDDMLGQLLNDDDVCAQPKIDGERRMIKNSTTGVNRRGLVIPLTEPMTAALAKSINGSADIDGEMVGDAYTVFDMIAHEGRDLRTLPYRERLAMLHRHVTPFSAKNCEIKIIPTAFTAAEKRALLARLQKENAEGIVFKRLDAPYTHGRPHAGGAQLKYKFLASATVLVSAQNEGRRSVVMSVKNEQGAWREIGSVTIAANQAIPETGRIVEVRYLYAYPRGSLFQPVYAGPRPDMEHDDCVETQLKYKAGA